MPKIKAFFALLSQPRQQHQILLIKGSYYYDADHIDASGQLSVKMPLQLCPEPDNEYDANAIQVWVTVPTNRTCLLGYIPKSEAKRINGLLNHQYLTACRLETCYRQYQRLYLYVRITSRLTLWQRFQISWFT